ncbi:hypothetical protein ACO1ZF_25425, partial [Enterobacter kobei]|uniref:hypothetical protein n=1 Tax=Enterobacter kobei TaxID=208224 RepID=UPI003BF70123
SACLRMAMIWLSVKRDFFIEISRFRLRENSTYEHTGFSGGLPCLYVLYAGRIVFVADNLYLHQSSSFQKERR